jgi:hypothetical protein
MKYNDDDFCKFFGCIRKYSVDKDDYEYKKLIDDKI